MPYKENISPAYWRIEEGALQDIESILKINKFSINKTVWLVTPSVYRLLPKNGCGEIIQISSENRLKINKIEKARHYLYKEPSSIVISFGGGRVIDIGKLLAKETSRSFVSIPSILSSDAIASPIAIIDYNDKRVRVSALPPKMVIVDLDIIRNAPYVYNLSGVGDLMSNLSALNDWLLAEQKGIEHINPLAKYLAYNSALQLLRFSGELYGNKFLSFLAEGLILSGISMTVDGTSRPASGSEHNISHALDKILGTNRKQHGIQVGFATLLTLYLQGQYKLMQRLKKFYEKISFPVTFSELGISKEVFMEAVELAPSIRDRYTILNVVGKEEIIKAIDEVYER